MDQTPALPPRPVLLTGASGRLGAVLAASLAEAGWTLRLTDRHPFPGPLPECASFEAAELDDRPAIVRLAEGCAAILHLGGIPNDRFPFEAIAAANLAGAYAIYEAARLAGARVVFASSNHAFGCHDRPTRAEDRLDATAAYRPDGLYGLSKLYGEQMGRLYWDKHGVETVAIRIGSCTPAPVDARMLSTWISPADLARLCIRAVLAPCTGWSVVWGTSANPASFWAGDDRARLDWAPQDSAEPWRGVLEHRRSADPVAERLQGGAFASDGHDGRLPRECCPVPPGPL